MLFWEADTGKTQRYTDGMRNFLVILALALSSPAWADLTGKVKIETTARYKLADAAQAHRDLESHKTTGSVILQPYPRDAFQDAARGRRS